MYRPAKIVWAATAAILLSFQISASMAGADIKSRFDLPAEPLDKALRDFAVQANCNISYEPSLVAGLQAPAIKGEFTLASVLAILLTGTRLHAVNVNEDTIQVVEKPASVSQDATSSPSMRHSYGGEVVHMAYAGSDLPASSAPVSQSQPAGSNSAADKPGKDKDLEQITVTGTHIRGTTDSPSQVRVFTRDEIDAAGANTLQQFLQTLPENFGGVSENTVGSIAANSRSNNTVNGSAPNLRGLGAEATLVLINGHRVAPGNSDGGFVDISMIPLAAIERIEIVTDGASAIYGADAVGGVVNIILRSKLDGAESRAEYGSVTKGTMHDLHAAQTVGTEWTNGSGVLSYQYSDQTPLSAGSRDYLHDVLLPFNLIPEQVQHAAFADVNQEITEGFNVHGDALYSHRSTNFIFSQNDGIYGNYFDENPSTIDFYGASLGTTVKLPRESELAVLATYSESDVSQQTFEKPPPNQPLLSYFKSKSAIVVLDANLDGVLTTLPGGPLRYAIGAQYRRESFGQTFLYPPTDNTFYPKRNVGSGYIELHVPVVGSQSGANGDPALELTVADREEHHSDFGSSNNPQAGLIWKPLSGLSMRSTYGTSFTAPLLSQLNPIPNQVVPFPGATFNPAPGGTPNTLLLDGGNPNLKPEKATVWTVGVDLKPMDGHGLSLKLTFYDILYKSEITAAGTGINTVNAFVYENILGPQIVQRNPPAALIQQLISEPTYVNPFGIDPNTIGAILDGRYLNLSTVKTRGLDFGLGFKTALMDTQIDTGIDGTYIFAFDNQFSPSAPVTSFLNTTYNPTNLKFRGRLSATRNSMTAGIFVNFTNDYTDNNVVPNGHVASWTTVDAVVSYAFNTTEMPMKGVSIGFSATNLANRDPPFVSNPFSYPITYDGINANPLGRYLSLRLQKRW